eukprot:2290762-Prymnesium_polylepis.1
MPPPPRGAVPGLAMKPPLPTTPVRREMMRLSESRCCNLHLHHPSEQTVSVSAFVAEERAPYRRLSM